MHGQNLARDKQFVFPGGEFRYSCLLGIAASINCPLILLPSLVNALESGINITLKGESPEESASLIKLP